MKAKLYYVDVTYNNADNSNGFVPRLPVMARSKFRLTKGRILREVQQAVSGQAVSVIHYRIFDDPGV